MMGWLTGSRRQDALAAARHAIDEQAVRIAEAEEAGSARDALLLALQTRLDQQAALLDAMDGIVAQMARRINEIEARIAGVTGSFEPVRHDIEQLREVIVAEQAHRRTLEQTTAKLEKRVDAQADEARVAATALLQRIEGVTRTAPRS